MKITQTVIEVDIDTVPKSDVVIQHKVDPLYPSDVYEFELTAPDTHDREKLRISVYPNQRDVEFGVYNWDRLADAITLDIEQTKSLMACLAHILEKIENA